MIGFYSAGAMGNTAPVVDPYFANVVSLLHFNGTDGATATTDETGRAWTFRTSAQLDTAQAKFGPSSLLIGGASTSRIDCASSSDFAFGTGDFTIEGFLRVTSVAASFQMIHDGRVLANSVPRPTLYLSGSSLVYYASGGNRVSGGTVPTNTWIHYMYSRAGTTGRLGLNGTILGSWTDNLDYEDHPVTLGNGGHTPYDAPVVGWIDEVRVTKGVARYTGAYTPPSSPFPNS